MVFEQEMIGQPKRLIKGPLKAAGAAGITGLAGYGAYKASQEPKVQQTTGKVLYKSGSLLGKEKEAAEMAMKAPGHVTLGYAKGAFEDAKSKASRAVENIKSGDTPTTDDIKERASQAVKNAGGAIKKIFKQGNE